MEEENDRDKSGCWQECLMDLQPLTDVGMTQAEARVYVALLELGSSTAGPIISRSGLQSSVVHMSLQNLLAKGFVSTVKEGKKNHYDAIAPKYLKDFLEERKARLEEAVPQLDALRASAQEEPQITSYKGVRGVKELLYELLDAPGKEHHTFGSTIKSTMLGDEWWVRYHAKRAKRGITAKLLFNGSLKPWTETHAYPARKVRFTDYGFEPLTETIIRGDCVGIIVWLDRPVGVLMRHPSIAASYDEFFNLLWKAGK